MSTISSAQTQRQQRGIQPRRRIVRRLIRWTVILLLALVIIDFVLLPIGFALVATSDAHENVGAPPAGFEAVTWRMMMARTWRPGTHRP